MIINGHNAFHNVEKAQAVLPLQIVAAFLMT